MFGTRDHTRFSLNTNAYPLEVAPSYDFLEYAARCCVYVFVFPDADDEPAGLGQSFVGVSIASHVSIELLRPPLCVSFGRGFVLGAAVPKAAIDEHRNFGGAEDDVGASPHPGQHAPVNTEA